MKHGPDSLERARIQAWARDHRLKGYTVIVDPRPAELPDFLLRFQPDIIAHGPEGSIVVEVKSRTALQGGEQLAALARAVEGQPGWRLDLVVTNPRGETGVPDDAEVADTENLKARLETAERLAQERQLDAAMLLAWSAIEGILRNVAAEEAVYLGRRGPSYVTKRLYSLGFLSRDDYLRLEDALSYRNSLVHGFAARRLRKATIMALIDLARRLLPDSQGLPGAR
jgi:hypothetical protein